MSVFNIVVSPSSSASKLDRQVAVEVVAFGLDCARVGAESGDVAKYRSATGSGS